MSPHDPKTIYFGGNVLIRSTDRGDTWSIISHDLTRGKPGASQNRGHTITTIAESPLQPGLIYIGTDDGKIHLTRDGGQRWQNLTELIPGAPRNGTVSRVETSHTQASVV